jgi:hypothetical protein
MKRIQRRLMNYTTILILQFALAFSLSAQQESPANVGLKWGFGALVGPAGNKTLVAVSRDTALRSGDELKMVVHLTRECYVYVISQNPQGELSLLFPYDFRQFTTDYAVGKNYYIPKGRPWFVLDKQTGRETFFVLASADRLLSLEALVSEYLETEPSKRGDLAAKVIDELRDVRKRYRNFQTLAERPISIGGNVRGTARTEDATRRPDVATIMTEISANNFYARTYSIDHQ